MEANLLMLMTKKMMAFLPKVRCQAAALRHDLEAHAFKCICTFRSFCQAEALLNQHRLALQAVLKLIREYPPMINQYK